ncbi:hypothetical protein [Fodinicurvata sp. EGI_FJ10296]|uniref:hypothetical protein n=1 Tax=Fodinicurvata sp. EGI_FJ10296 TaxID=3231908 RepID=UPI00345697E2
MISIRNNKSLISSTNYWDSIPAQNGLFFLSGNAGAWRLLVPDNQKHFLAEMATAKAVEIDLGVNNGRQVVTIWFEDGTETPFQLGVEDSTMDRVLTPSATPQPLLIYTQEGLQQEHQIRKVM